MARQKTALAQGLCDAGFLMLVDAVRNGWYPYPNAEDYETPRVRKMLRQQMCEEALKVLSERLYLAGQATLLHQTSTSSAPPPMSDETRARLRQRPSWMATGG